MSITHEFIDYLGSVFTDENGKTVEFEAIHGRMLRSGSKTGKIVETGYISIYEHGYSGGYTRYAFVAANLLEIEDLKDNQKFEVI